MLNDAQFKVAVLLVCVTVSLLAAVTAVAAPVVTKLVLLAQVPGWQGSGNWVGAGVGTGIAAWVTEVHCAIPARTARRTSRFMR
jgi:hypothetical protein